MPKDARQGGAPLPGLVRGLRWAVFVLLLLAAIALLLVEPALQRAGRASTLSRWGAGALLVAFAAGFAAYRFLLVRAGRYPAGKAFVHVGLVVAVVAGVLGLPPERRSAVQPSGPVDLAGPLASSDATARAMAAELVRHRERTVALAHVSRLVDLLDDPSPEVRRQAHASLVALAGRDAGGQGAGARDRWREFWRGHGAPGAGTAR
jgi:hypothetical protein